MLRTLSLLACVASCASTPDDAATNGTAERGALQMGLVTGHIYDDLASHLGERMNDFAQLGVQLLRVEIEGDDYTRYRRIVDAARRYNIDVLALVQSNAIHVDPKTIGADDYANRAIAVIDRLMREIPNLRYVELENEPDGYDYRTLDVNDNANRYATLVTRVFEHYVENRLAGSRPQIVAFDFVRPDERGYHLVYDAQVITNHRNYFREAHGLPDGLPADIVSIHGYGDFSKLPDEAGYAYGGQTMAQAVDGYFADTFASQPSARHDDQRNNGSLINQSPVWFTEIGYGWQPIGGEQRQATALHQAYATMRAHPQIKAAFYYDYRDDESGGTETAGLRGTSGTRFPNPCYDDNHPDPTLPFAPHAAYSAYQQEAGVGGRSTFYDVPACHWAHDAIEAMYARGITLGCNGGSYADGTLRFCEGDDVTTEEIRVFVARASGTPGGEPAPSPAGTRGDMAYALAHATGADHDWTGYFTDVPSWHPRVREIEGLAARGVARGYAYPDGHHQFHPDEHLTRSQMAAFLSRAYGLN